MGFFRDPDTYPEIPGIFKISILGFFENPEIQTSRGLGWKILVVPKNFEKSRNIFAYLLSSLGGFFDTGGGRIVLWITHTYASEHMI